MRHLALFLTLILIFGAACEKKLENPTLEDFNEQYKTLETDKELSDLCKLYMDNLTDIDDLRDVQSKWEAVDAERARAYALEKAEKNPNSAEYQYLYGRVAESVQDQIKYGRKAIELNPDWPYGYRLVNNTYSSLLFDKRGTDEEMAYLQTELSNDEALFDKYVDISPDDAMAMMMKASYQIYNKDYKDALATMDAGKAFENPRWPSGKDYAAAYAGMGEMDKAYKAIEDDTQKIKERYGLTDEEALTYTRDTYGSVLSKLGLYKEAVDYLKKQKNLTADDYYAIACFYSLMNDTSSAFTYLNKAAENGFDNYRHAADDEDLADLRGTSDWQAVMDKFRANWDNGADERKAEALSEKLDITAPDWSLKDIDGNVVKLSDLKGSVVVLDFWATWCGPCRMAMPMIDEYVDNVKPDGVRVFSINVWEKGQAKAKKFMDDNGYDMELLFGNNDLTDAYEVTGIPTLVVIDKDGIIRYKEVGVTDALVDNLKFWTEDLL